MQRLCRDETAENDMAVAAAAVDADAAAVPDQTGSESYQSDFDRKRTPFLPWGSRYP